jgi:hypothetical protein
MKLTRSHIRKMILEAIAGEPEVEEPEGEVVDLFDNPNFRGDLDTFQRVRTQGLASQSEKEDDLEDEFANYIANLPGGYEEEEEEEIYLAEQKGDDDNEEYVGDLGIGVSSGGKSGRLAGLQATLRNIVNQLKTAKGTERVALNKERDDVQRAIDNTATT